MIVVHVSKCPPSLRGDLSKWLFEVSTGVYVGNVSHRVREKLWERILSTVKSGKAVMVYSVHDEQHLKFRVHGSEQDVPVDYDGITIMKHLVKKSGTTSEATYVSVPKPIWPESEFIALDLETTGLDPENEGITEIALVRFKDEKPKERLRIYIQCDHSIPDNIQKLTGITPELLKQKGISEFEALQKVLDFIKDLPVVCHNAEFDKSFLNSALAKYGFKAINNYFFDTMILARKVHVDTPNYRLKTLADYFGLSVDKVHEALADAEITGELVIKLKDFAERF